MADNRPNLLWIMTDQLRYHALGCSGDANTQTPNIDRLAAEGVACDAAFSHYPVCMPFRAGLLTGQYNNVNGVRIHGDLLPPDRRTIAHAFRQAGYRTSWVGKWHLASVSSLSGWTSGEDYWVHPFLRGGFEDFYGFDLSNHYYNTYYCTGDFVDPIKIDGYQTDGLADISLRYLSETAAALDQPWFHVLSFEAPHPGNGADGNWGFPAPPEFEDRFRPQDIILRDNVPQRTADDTRRTAAGYYAMIANIDHNVGRVLAWLQESGQAENTLVVFFSDHGEMLGSHGRPGKQVVFEESIHVPLILRLPGTIPGNTRHNELISGIDIFPTCAGLCQVSLLPEVQGVNHSLSLLGSDGHHRGDILIQWLGQSRYHWGNHPYRAIRTQRHTYCVSSAETNLEEGGVFRLLLDNIADPLQLHNLYGRWEAIDLQRELHGRLCRAIRESGEEPPDFIVNVAAELGLTC